MGTLNSWDIVDANNNATPPDGWPENTMQYSEVNDTGRAVQGTLKRYFADINGSLVAGGVADAYTVSLNETGYTTYFTGMYFACEINADNTGATTINVNGIGAQNVVTPDGSALGANTLKSGGIYEFRYDGTNFQLGGSVGGSSVTVDQIILSNTNDPDLVDTDVALNVGTDDPDNNQHIEVGPSDIQSKSDATTAAALDLNALGGNVTVGAQSGSGTVTLYDAGQIALSTFQAGVSVAGDVAASTPPVEADVPDSYIEIDDLNSVNRLGFIGFSLSSVFQINNEMRGGNIHLIANDTSGTSRTMLVGDPDGATQLYDTGSRRIETETYGMNLYGSIANTTPPVGTNDVRAVYWDTDGTDVLAQIGFTGSDTFLIQNRFHGGGFSVEAESSGGVNRFLCNGDPDGVFNIYHAGTNVAATLAAASGGLQVNNQLTGGGLERVLTTSDIGAGAPFRGALVYHNTTQVIGASTLAAVIFNSESYDTDSIHDNVTNNSRLTVPSGVTRVRLSGGVYRGVGGPLDGSLSFNKNGGSVYIGFAESQTGNGGGSGQRDEAHSVHSPILPVTGGDYFELLFDNADTSSATLGNDRTWFAMEIVE